MNIVNRFRARGGVLSLVLMLAIVVVLLASPVGVLAAQDDQTPPAPEANAPTQESPQPTAETAQDALPTTDDLSPLATSPATDGWTEYTGALTAGIVSFAIAGNSQLTGHLGIGSPQLTLPDPATLQQAAYYLRYDNGTQSADITYAYRYNTLHTSDFYLVINTGSAFETYNMGQLYVKSVWLKQIEPGYVALMLMGSLATEDQTVTLDVSVTMTPSQTATVQYEWNVTNLGAAPLNLAAVFAIDTELQGNDNAPIYSAGTNNGMYSYADKSNARLYFPHVALHQGGPAGYAPAQWQTNITEVFGNSLDGTGELDVEHAYGDVLLAGADSAVYFRYAWVLLSTDESQGFVYQIGLEDAAFPLVGATPPAASVTNDVTSKVDPKVSPKAAIPAQAAVPLSQPAAQSAPVLPVVTSLPATGDRTTLLPVLLICLSAGILFTTHSKTQRAKRTT